MQRAKVAAIFLIIIITVGTIGYMAIEGWSFLDALYMVVITLSTVGYKESHPMSQGGHFFTILLIIIGAGVGVYALGSVMRPIIEGEMRKVLGRRKVEKEMKNIRDHYVVCGFGRMGSYICRELKEKKKLFVVIEKDEQSLLKLEREGHLYLLGDATEDDMLLEAGVAQSKRSGGGGSF